MKPCCNKKPVYTMGGGEKLCRNHFLTYFEKKVRKTIRTEKFFGKKEKILVACSGGKDSTVVLYLLKKIIKNRNITIEAFHIDQSISNYSRKNKKNIREFCKEQDIKLNETSFRKEFGYSLCYIQSVLKSKGHDLKSCSICGILRRYILNRVAKEMKATVVVTGHNLDDEAQSIIMNIFKNNVSLLSRLGPISGIAKNKNFVPRVKPLYFCTEDEVKLFVKLMKFNVVLEPCPCSLEAYRRSVLDMLNDFEKKFPGTKYGVVNSFLEMKPSLVTKYKKGKVKICKECGEASAGEICNTCKLINLLK